MHSSWAAALPCPDTDTTALLLPLQFKVPAQTSAIITNGGYQPIGAAGHQLQPACAGRDLVCAASAAWCIPRHLCNAFAAHYHSLNTYAMLFVCCRRWSGHQPFPNSR